jgi:hypothetical protein
MFEGRLIADKLLSQETISGLRALSEPSMEWLGNIPIGVLAELRERNENEEFRKRISGFTSPCTKPRWTTLTGPREKSAEALQL